MASDSGNWRSRAAGTSSSRDDGPPSRAGGGGGLRGDGWRSGGGGNSGGGGGGGDNWRGGGNTSSSRPAGERPRLNLKARGAGGGTGSSAPPTEKLSNLSTLDNKDPPSNSRAAALGAAPSGVSTGMRREVCYLQTY